MIRIEDNTRDSARLGRERAKQFNKKHALVVAMWIWRVARVGLILALKCSASYQIRVASRGRSIM